MAMVVEKPGLSNPIRAIPKGFTRMVTAPLKRTTKDLLLLLAIASVPPIPFGIFANVWVPGFGKANFFVTFNLAIESTPLYPQYSTVLEDG